MGRQMYDDCMADGRRAYQTYQDKYQGQIDQMFSQNSGESTDPVELDKAASAILDALLTQYGISSLGQHRLLSQVVPKTQVRFSFKKKKNNSIGYDVLRTR